MLRDMVGVIGATGQQGGAVVDALLSEGAAVVAIVRDPASAGSQALSRRGVTIRVADQEDEDSLVEALHGLTGLFFMTTFNDSVKNEVSRGTRVGSAADKAGVERIIYSSVGGAERHSGIPHFESKRLIEEYLISVFGNRLKIVRPVYFMDNLNYETVDGDSFLLKMPMPGNTPLQLIAVRDIGRVASTLLLDPAHLSAQSVEIAGDELTPEQIASHIGAHLGVPARFEQTSIDSLPNDDLKAMFRWFSDTPAYTADLERTLLLGHDTWDLNDWLLKGSRLTR